VKVPNPDVEVLRTAVVHDRYGTAAAVELRMRGKRAQAALPLSLTVSDAAGKKLYANDLAGLAPSLTHVPLLRPGERAWWVNDQVQVEGARKLRAVVGSPSERPPAQPPRLVASGLRLERDTSGAYTQGTLRNASAVEQRQVTVFAVAERAGRVVAAGRAGVERVKAHKAARFKVFWIGDPRRARVRVFAPPTVLEEER
jgi:hypothetical protein